MRPIMSQSSLSFWVKITYDTSKSPRDITMLQQVLFAVCLTISALHAEEFSDPTFVDTSGMGKPRVPDGKKHTGVPPLLISRKLGVHTGYFPLPGNFCYSSGVAASLTNDINDVVSFGFDRLDKAFKPDKFLSRFVLANVYYYATLPLHLINDMTRYHWATASRIAATGLQPEFWDLGVGTEKSIYHGNSIWGLWSAPFRAWKDDSFSRAFSLKRYAPVVLANKEKLFTSEKASEHYDDAKLNASKDLAAQKYTEDTPSVTAEEHQKLTASIFNPRWDVVRLAAGYNDQADRARELQQKSYWEEAHYMDAAHYLRARWLVPVLGLITTLQKDSRTNQPSEQDTNLTLLEHAYAAQNVELSSGKIAALTTLSVLLSGSFYKTLRHANWEYYDQGTQFYKAYEWHGFRIPDVVPYLNTNGLSYHVTTGYRISPTFAIPVCFEFQFIGEKTVEGSTGVMLRFPDMLNLDVQANVLISQEGIGGDIKASVTPWGSVCAEAGVAYHNSKTLEGKRHILSYKNGESDYEIFAKISVVY